MSTEYIPDAESVAFFHGEDWMRCPHCDFSFEFYDALYERDGIKKADGYADYPWSKRIFICPQCGNKFKIS